MTVFGLCIMFAWSRLKLKAWSFQCFWPREILVLATETAIARGKSREKHERFHSSVEAPRPVTTASKILLRVQKGKRFLPDVCRRPLDKKKSTHFHRQLAKCEICRRREWSVWNVTPLNQSLRHSGLSLLQPTSCSSWFSHFAFYVTTEAVGKCESEEVLY